MNCPHCGAAPRAGEKFCPKCSRLLDSPLLALQRELAAARARTIGRLATGAPSPLAAPGQGLMPAPTGPPAPPGATGAARPAKPARKQRKAKAGPPAAVPTPVAPPPPQPPRVQAPATQPTTSGAPPKAAPSKAGAPRAKDAAHDQRALPDAGPTPALRVLGLFNLLLIPLLIAGVAALREFEAGTLGHDLAEPATLAAAAVGALAALAALGLWTVRPFGHTLQRLLSVLWLPIPPFGTLLGLLSLAYLARPSVRLLFSGRQADSWSSAEVQQLTRSRRFAPLVAVAFVVVYGLAVLSVIGLASGVGPWLESRVTVSQWIAELGSGTTGDAPREGPMRQGEQAVVQDLMTVLTAQQAYASVNGGFYDRLECLGSSSACIPGNPPRDMPLGEEFLVERRHGHEFSLQLGPAPSSRPRGTSATSVVSFAYVARPAGASAGAPAYCVDQSAAQPCRFTPADLPVDGSGCPAGCVSVK